MSAHPKNSNHGAAVWGDLWVAARVETAPTDAVVADEPAAKFAFAPGDATLPTRIGRRAVVAAAVSTLVHTALLVALGLVTAPMPQETVSSQLMATTSAAEFIPPVDLQTTLDDPRPQRQTEVLSAATPRLEMFDPGATPAIERPKPAAAAQTQPRRGPIADWRDLGGATGSIAIDPGKYKPQLGQVRSPAQRLQAVMYRGGNKKSEQAVARALDWLRRHQSADGGWSFDHRGGECKGACANPGTLVNARLAATAMALLPFLAAGETHKQGSYKKQVEAGLKFLVRGMRTTPQGGQLTAGGGTLYAQALATIALCEALAMTRDRDLILPAQAAVNFIINCQDPQGGGWRYVPGQPGDTSVTGWQVMALKSADNAYLVIPPVVLERTRGFLDSVQFADGSAYGYLDSQNSTTASTAVGLLCRMVLGWKHDHRPLIDGVDGLILKGVQPNNIYYNFYATQVLHHFGGEPWEKWNSRMRDHLIATQALKGHEAGSWFFVETTPEDVQAPLMGGRLYSTSLAALTLEVYYRYLPLYGNRLMIEEPVEEKADEAAALKKP